MSDHRELKELAELLVLGTLETTDRERLEAHLQDGCQECEEVIRAASRMADQLVLAVPCVTEPTSLVVAPSSTRGWPLPFRVATAPLPLVVALSQTSFWPFPFRVWTVPKPSPRPRVGPSQRPKRSPRNPRTPMSNPIERHQHPARTALDQST